MGKKHGKSQCDGFFGCLKSWVTFKIKTRQVIITSAHEFFRFCKEEYETPQGSPGCCQHYRVMFQFIRPSDVRRHHDCMLDEAVQGTHSIYSVRNTPDPLRLKVRNVPCLCANCIADNGDKCDNDEFADAWYEVELVPVKGQNKHKYLKRKHPRSCQSGDKNTAETRCEDRNDSDAEEVPDIIIDDGHIDGVTVHDDTTETVYQNLPGESELFIDLTDGADNSPNMTYENVEDSDVIITGRTDPMSIILPTSESPDYHEQVYWESILSSLERCTTFQEMEDLVNELQMTLSPLRNRKKNIYFDPEQDYIDTTAAVTLPADRPKNVHPIRTVADGNCLCRSISKGYSGTDGMHLEIRARIIINGIINKKHYLSTSCLNRGATLI